jgi:outer membrane protein OmpA-like peptidoglycan-associated protein
MPSAPVQGRGQLRTEQGWRDYDRANFWVVSCLVLAWLVWLVWTTSHFNQQAEQAEAGGGNDTPAHLKLSDQTVDLRLQGGVLVLTGSVPDEAASRSLQQAAESVFSSAQVSNRLQVNPRAVALTWLDHAPDMMRTLRGTEGDAGIRVAGNQVMLSGQVAQDASRTAREVMARQWFGRQAQLDNQIVVAPGSGAAPALAAAQPAASAPVQTLAAAPAPAAAPVLAPATAPVAATAAAPSGACAALPAGVAVRFHPNSPKLTDEGRRTLRELLPCLQQGRWLVGGHTDSNGDPAFNQQLTQQRAESVREYLVGKQVPADRLKAQGFGASRPVAGNDTAEDRQRNRRISFEPQA